MYINRYTNRKKIDMVQLIGTKKEFRLAGISLQGAEEHKAGRFNIRGTEAEMKDLVEAAGEYLESIKPKAWSGIREWLVDNGKSAKLFVEWIEGLGARKTIHARLIAQDVGLSKEEAKTLVHLMFKDGWLDSNGKKTEIATSEIKEWRELKKVLSPSKTSGR